MFNLLGTIIRQGPMTLLLYYLLLWTGVLQVGSAAGNTVLETRAPAAVAVGEPIELELTVRQANDVAGYELHLQFDTAVAEFGGLRQRENDLRKLGRDVGPLSVTELPDGAAFGLYSCPTSDCLRPHDSARAGAAEGTLSLATAVISPQEAGLLEIRLSAVRLVDSAGNPVEVSLPTRTLTVQVGEGETFHAAPSAGWELAPAGAPAAVADLTGDGLLNHADVMEVALEWALQREQQAPCGQLAYPQADVNQDGCIDVADVQAMAAAQMAGASEGRIAPQTGADQPTTAADTTLMVFTVDTTMDDADSTPDDGICASNSGCTLRAAIQEANAHAGPDRIEFNIPGSGIHTIQLSDRLPPLNDLSGGTEIDGYTQPSAVPNDDPLASNAQIRVELSGNGSAGFDALHITSGNNVVRGLAFYNFRRPIWLYGAAADHNAIVGNFIGTNAAATFGSAGYTYLASGLVIENGASHNEIGREELADRNVISGNGRHGIEFYGELTEYNLIYNNIVGLSPDGSRRLQNFRQGIDISEGASHNVIGGTAANQRNIISGNGELVLDDYSAGVEISHDQTTVENRVVGNCLGTDLTCQTAPAWAYNSHYGIRLEDNVANNLVMDNVIGNSREGGIQLDNYTSGNHIAGNHIGISPDGTAIPNQDFGVRIKYYASNNVIGPNNVIANNPVGVQVEYNTEYYNTITRNSIYANDQLGIDLGPYHGVSLNDAGDEDEGANRGLNFPTLIGASSTQVSGLACAEAIVAGPCTIEVFLADRNSSDQGAGDYGQGRFFVGEATTAADGSFTVAVSGLNAGDFVTATATDAEGNTSEFSHNILVQSEPTQSHQLLVPIVRSGS